MPEDIKQNDESWENGSTLARMAKGQGIAEDAETNIKFDIPGICRTCAHSVIIKQGTAEHKRITVKCSELGVVVPHDIVECTSYWKRGQMSLRDMASLAYLVDIRPGPPSWEKGI